MTLKMRRAVQHKRQRLTRGFLADFVAVSREVQLAHHIPSAGQRHGDVDESDGFLCAVRRRAGDAGCTDADIRPHKRTHAARHIERHRAAHRAIGIQLALRHAEHAVLHFICIGAHAAAQDGGQPEAPVTTDTRPGSTARRDTPGSISFVPAAAGLVLASAVVRELGEF